MYIPQSYFSLGKACVLANVIIAQMRTPNEYTSLCVENLVEHFQTISGTILGQFQNSLSHNLVYNLKNNLRSFSGNFVVYNSRDNFTDNCGHFSVHIRMSTMKPKLF